MTKAKLIKREDAIQLQQEKLARKAQKQSLKKTIDIVGEWIDQRQMQQRLSPRVAFAALFAQPQPE